MKTSAIIALLALPLHFLSLPGHAQAPPARSPGQSYATHCAGCHTPEPANTLRASRLARESTVEDVAAFIRAGRPSRGMPAFANALTAPQARELATWLKARITGTMIGRRIEAEDLRFDRSSGFSKTRHGDVQFLQFIDRGSHLCYDDVDLTGARSLEYRYAKGPGEPPRRFAVVAFEGEFVGSRRHALGEKITQLTGGWTDFRTERIGFARELHGRHRLCLIGMEGGGVFNLDWIALSDQPGANDGITNTFAPPAEPLSAGGHRFRLELAGEIDGEFWSLDFLDADTIVATQKSGALWLFRGGQRIGPVRGIPEVAFVGQGGLLSVRRHPDYARNGWIYLTYSEAQQEKTALVIVRGRLRGDQWVDQETVYRDPRFYYDSGAHFGARITFASGYLFFGIGERDHREFAQALTNPFGKIHRLFDDGRTPDDNPFVTTPGAVPTIWSLGHRNPQGLYFDPRTRLLWSTEHGPKGGDEVNLIRRGANYGWPLATFGINYDGTPVSSHQELPGMAPPLRHWSPSPGLSNLIVYDGGKFPRWQGHLLVTTLANQQLKLIRIAGDSVVDEEILLDGRGRIRDVNVGPDGLPYVALNQPNGQIFRLVPE